MSTPAAAMLAFWEGAFVLRGRATRSEYWWWMLLNLLVTSVFLMLIPALFDGQPNANALKVGPFGSLLFADLTVFSFSPANETPSPPALVSFCIAAGWTVATTIPGVCVLVRRLHDSNLSGWWALLAFAPLGSVILLLLALRGSRPEGARFDASLEVPETTDADGEREPTVGIRSA